MPVMRSMSEPPEEEDTNLKTGLRGGFPIKINGQALGSQDNLQEFGQGADIFGPRIRSRQSSVAPLDGESEAQFGRRRSLRGTTPVKIGGVEFTTNAAKEELVFSTPFGSTQAGAGQIKKGGMMGKRPLPQYQNNSSVFTQNSETTQKKSSSLLNLSLIQETSTNMTKQTVLASENFSLESQVSECQSENIFKVENDQVTKDISKSMLNREDNIQGQRVDKSPKQKKEDHVQKKIIIRVAHSQSKETVDVEEFSKKTPTFSNQIETECCQLNVDQSNKHEMENALTNNNTVEQVKETNSVHSKSSTSELFLQQFENTSTNSNNFDQNINDEQYKESNKTISTHSEVLDLNINPRPQANEISPAPFLLQRPKVFQKQTNKQVNNVYSKISNNQKVDTLSQKLEDAIYNIRETNTSSKNDKGSFDVNYKTFKELHREITPFDLPVLSPVPQKAKEKKGVKYNVQDIIKQDLQEVENLNLKDERAELSEGYSSLCTLESNSFENYTTEESFYYKEECKKETSLKENEYKSKFLEYGEMSDEKYSGHKNSACTSYALENNCDLQTYSQNHVYSKEVESHKLAERLEHEMEEVKEFNVEAKIVLNNKNNECKNTITSLIKESKQNSNIGDFTKSLHVDNHYEETVKSNRFKNELQDLGIFQTCNDEHSNYTQTTEKPISKEDNLIKELNDKFNKDHESEVTLIKSDLQDTENVGIAEHHKYMINKCIQQLEESSTYQLDEELLKVDQSDKSYEEIHFTTEKNIDSTDLEHVHVMDKKADERRMSFPSENIQRATFTESRDTSVTGIDSSIENETDSEAETENNDTNTYKCEGHETTSASDSNSFFLTESNSENDTSYSWQFKLEQPKMSEKRRRNRTIDYHSLPSLFWEGAVKDYHEKQFSESESVEVEVQTEDKLEDKSGLDIAKDGLSLILQRLKGIESKLDNLKEAETTIVTRQDTRRNSLPGRFSTITNLSNETILQLEENMDLTPTPTGGNILDDQGQKDINNELDTNLEEINSNCSTPTFMEIPSKPKANGYESDSTAYHESDCEIIVDEKSDNDEASQETWTYKPFNLNISEISDLESEEEDPEERNRRIETLAAAINLPNNRPMGFQRGELNMEIDTLSERSEEEGDSEEQKPKPRSRRPSGRKRSMSRDRNVAKIRYCWRCHHAGHENWQCREDVQPGGWCPRCLETSHWEDACWVEAAHVLCPVCSVPGHLPCVHQATDFRQRKLVIDTFGWLSFKDWFQDLTFRSWWNCSGYTGVPLYKIMQRNPNQDLDLGFDET